MDAFAEGASLGEIEAPPGIDTTNCVAVEIKGESMRPLRDGWVVIYTRDHAGVDKDALGQLCVVKLADDGPIYIKELRAGSQDGKFTLTSWNEKALRNVAVEWAAPVRAIVPR